MPNGPLSPDTPVNHCLYTYIPYLLKSLPALVDMGYGMAGKNY